MQVGAGSPAHAAWAVLLTAEIATTGGRCCRIDADVSKVNAFMLLGAGQRECTGTLYL
jgi:hypothetical protein